MLFNDSRLKLIEDLSPLIQKELSLKNKSLIFDQDLHQENIIILLKGSYKLTHLLPNSKEFILGYYKAPSILLSSFFENNNFFSLFRAEALEDCVIGLIPNIQITHFSKSLQYDLLKYNDLGCQKIYLQMRDLLYFPKKEALFSILIRLSNTFGIKIDKGIKLNISISNIDLAEYIGTAPETVSRLLVSLKKEGIIDLEDKHIIIKDINYMKKALNCSMCRQEICEI